jgi:hypothetical protein
MKYCCIFLKSGSFWMAFSLAAQELRADVVEGLIGTGVDAAWSSNIASPKLLLEFIKASGRREISEQSRAPAFG